LKPDELLAKGLRELGLGPSAEQAEKFMAYLRELKRWQRAMSLTSLRSEEDMVVKHFVDSCLYLRVLPAGTGAVADVGSGAGFPGLPIKIMRPDLKVYLIESSAKKCSFLRHMQRTLRLDGLEVIESRVEDVGGLAVDAALTRALYSVEDFARKASHILREGGVFVLNKGPKAKEEVEGSALPCEVVPMELPVSGARRNLVVVRKE
jgi:16S rRNA (guanine527-N7)-methyltransferase